MFKSLMLGLVAGVVFCVGVFGQTGTLGGRVTDATGAIIAGAKVTITNQATGVERTVISNPSGNFVQPFILPGDYRVNAEKAGFEKYETSNIRVDIDQKVDLEIALKVGAITSTVEVVASGVSLATTSATITTTIDSKAFMDLPLDIAGGRNPMGLAILTPGVISGGGSTPWISGGRNASSEITVDGTTIILPENNVSVNTTGFMPVLDSVQEFSVVTNSLAAEYGRTGGGTINMSTRGGANILHGSAYEYMGNQHLNTQTWANNSRGIQLKTPFLNNIFGGTIGGPIYVPNVYNGKNKTFFFVSEQSTRTRNSASNTSTVPSDAWRTGDFSQLLNGQGAPIVIYDPKTGVDDGTGQSRATRLPFPGNIIPTNRIDPVAATLMKAYPAANSIPINGFTLQNNFNSTGKSPSNDDKFDSRIDQNFSQKFRMFARGSYEWLNQGIFVPWGPGNPAQPAASGGGYNTQASYNITANTVYTMNPSTIVTANVGWNHFNELRKPYSAGVCPSSIGMPAYMDVVAQTYGECEFPQISPGTISSLGQGSFDFLDYHPAGWNVKTDLTKIHGNHAIKTGVEFRKQFMNFAQFGSPDGAFNFGTGQTQQLSTGSTSTTQGFGPASFLLGFASSGSVSHSFHVAEASASWGLYVQDDWKVSSRLTLNLGVRYEVDIPRTERYNRLSYFDINATNPYAGMIPDSPTCPHCSELKGMMMYVTPDHRHQTGTDLNNVGPRFGFAFKLDDKTVLRGAYSVMYAGSALVASGTSGSSGTEGFQTTTNMQPTLDNGLTIFGTLSNPYPNGFNLPMGKVNSPTSGNLYDIGLGVSESFFADNANPMIQQWNGSIQRELKGGFLVTAGYLGSGQHHLIDGENQLYDQVPDSYLSLGSQLTTQIANPFYGIIQNKTSVFYQPKINEQYLLTPYPDYSGINAYRKPGANANYNSFILSAQKRFSHGLNLLASFTGGKLLDDAGSVVNFLGATSSKQDAYDRKAEKSVSAQDESRSLVISYNYEVPVGRHGHFLNGVPKALDFIIGGWQTNGIYNYHTGLPLQISNGGNSSQLLAPGIRPNSNGNDPKLSGSVADRLTEYFDTSVFYQTPNYAFGNLSRTVANLRGPSTHAFDASMFKKFRFRERFTFEYRAEAINVFNHPVWNSPNTTVNSVGAAGFGTITSANSQRKIQMSLRASF